MSNPLSHKHLAVLGAGKMGGILLRAFLDQKLVSASHVAATVRHADRAEALAKERRIRAVRLTVAGAFHSPLMEPAVEPIVERLSAIALRAPALPVAENVSGALEDDPDRLRELLGRHVVSPVRWAAGVRALAAAGATTFLEAGAGEVLTKLAKRVVPQAAAVAVGSPQVVRDILRA